MRCIDVPSFITLALIVPEQQNWTRKLNINLLSHWSLKYRSWPYYFGCIHVPSTRCKQLPSFITLALIVPEQQSWTWKLDINLSQWSLKYRSWLHYFGCIQLPTTRCIDVPSFITIALIVPEQQSWTRKLDINRLSHWSQKYRSWPYYFGCIQLPSTRCKQLPSFITLALIVPEQQSWTRKLNINLSQWNMKYSSWPNFYGCIQLSSTRCIDVPSFITLALTVPEQQSWNRKLDINRLSHWSQKYRSWPYYFGCIQLPSTRCKQLPSFITLALIVPEQQSWTRKLNINRLSHWSQKYRSWPYYFGCIQVPSSRCKQLPSFITLALIVPEQQSWTRKQTWHK